MTAPVWGPLGDHTRCTSLTNRASPNTGSLPAHGLSCGNWMPAVLGVKSARGPRVHSYRAGKDPGQTTAPAEQSRAVRGMAAPAGRTHSHREARARDKCDSRHMPGRVRITVNGICVLPRRSAALTSTAQVQRNIIYDHSCDEPNQDRFGNSGRSRIRRAECCVGRSQAVSASPAATRSSLSFSAGVLNPRV
jgi:hypothetical protein